MSVTWTHDVDAGLQEARRRHQPVILDFTAAPM
jgi:hypothetical protein